MPLSTAPLLAAVLVAASPAPPEKAAGPLRRTALVELHLLVPDEPAARRTVELVRRLAPVHARGFRVAVSPGDAELPAPPFVVVDPRPAQPFDARYLRVTAYGLAEADRARLLRGVPRVILLLAARADAAHAALRAAVEIAAEAARRERAIVNDPEARLTYAPETFLREVAETGFDGAVPNVSAHVHVHAYAREAGDGLLRTVTLGMSKLGLPDVAVNGHTRGESERILALVRAVCQRLDDAPAVEADGTVLLDVDRLASPRVRRAQAEFRLPGATGHARVGLSAARTEEGDAENRLLDVTFRGAPGAATQRQHAVLVALYGEDDPKPILHRANDPELRAATERARAELRDLKAPFQRGLPPGTVLQVKAPFDRGGRREYMWLEVTGWEREKVRGVLRSDPKIATDLASGAPVEVDEADVLDYLLRRPDGTEVGNHTTAVLRRARDRAAP